MPSLAELQDSVPDPTDFPNDINGLRKLDASLRCPICGDIFDAPMMLNCGHSFCSVCVRDALRNRKDTKECPQCRKPGEEGHLRKNGSLEETALCWKAARPAVLELIASLKKANDDILRLRKGKGKGVVRTAGDDMPARPTKRRRTSSGNNKSEKRTNGSSRLAAASAGNEINMISHSGSLEEDDDDDDDNEVLYIPSSDAEELAIEEAGEAVPVDCPLLCGNRVLPKHVDYHIESSCQKLEPIHTAGTSSVAKSSKALTSSAWKSVFQKGASSKSKISNKILTTEDRLVRPAYDAIGKDKKLRELCQKHDLPTTGSRDQLEQRHQKYVTYFNANLDRPLNERKSEEELLRDVKRWEDSLKMKKVEIKDTKTYIKRNNVHFKAQIEAMKARTPQTHSEYRPESQSQTGDVVSDSEGEMIL